MVTVTPIAMSGVFAESAEAFVAHKRAQGYKYYSEAKVLSRFCRFAETYGLKMPTLTTELILNWTAPREGEAKKVGCTASAVSTNLERISGSKGMRLPQLHPNPIGTAVPLLPIFLRMMKYPNCSVPPTMFARLRRPAICTKACRF